MTFIDIDHPALVAVHVIGNRYATTGREAAAIDHAVAKCLATWTVCLWLCAGRPR